MSIVICSQANKCMEEDCPHSIPHEFIESCDFVCRSIDAYPHCVEVKDEYNRGYETAQGLKA